MPAPSGDGLALGRDALRQLHQSLLARAPEQAVTILQEAGYGSGEGVFRAFAAWLPGATGIATPPDIDVAHFPGVLSDFLDSRGWGTVTVTPVGGAALAVDSVDWAEADPGSAEMPMCFFTAGMLADLLGRISGEPVAVMEVECRSRGDGRCRFLAAAPDTLQEVYQKMSEGKSYEEALAG